MRVACGVLLLALSAFAHDAVIFSNDQELSRDHPSLDALVSGASESSPLVFLVEPDFTLGQFSKQAAAYSSDVKSASALTQVVKNAKNSAQRYIENTVHVPTAVVVTSTNDFKIGSTIYIVAAEDWASLEILANSILPKFSGYTAVLTNTEAATQQATRVKRLSSDLVDQEEESQQDAAPKAKSAPQQQEAAAGKPFDLPLSLPAFNRSADIVVPDLPCLLYIEGINIIVSNKKGDVPSAFPSAGATILNGTFQYDDSFVTCPFTNNRTDSPKPQDFKFTIKVQPRDQVIGSNVNGQQFELQNQPIDIDLVFHVDLFGYWNLKSFTLNSQIAVDKVQGGKDDVVTGKVQTKKDAKATITYLGIGAVAGYGYNCGDTAAAWFETDTGDHFIGIGFHNFQVVLAGIQSRGTKDDPKPHYYNQYMGDCVGTFSPGSLMGIITGLVLITVFIFGFLMLNSVQTIDRFDDPKQKQILINVRE